MEVVQKRKMDFRFHATLKAYTEKDDAGNEIRYIRGVASDDQVDRQGERFSTRAVQRMVETAKQNLTLFGDHNHSWENTLGHIVDARFDNGAFEVTCQLESEEAQPKIKQLWAKLMSKTRLAFSIGGRVLKVIAEDVNGQTVRVLDDLELLELSVVGIPANPRTWLEAIVKSLEENPESGSQKPEEKQTLEDNQTEEGSMTEQEKKAMDAAHVAAIDKLKSEHEAALAALKANHEKTVKAAQDVLRQAQNEGKTLADKLAGVESARAELATQVADIRAKFDEAQAEVKTVTNERDALADQVVNLESAVKDKTSETAKIQQKATDLQAEFDRLSLSLTEANTAYEDLRAKYEQMSATQTQNAAEIAVGKKFKELQLFEAHRLAGLVEGETFNSDTTKKKLAALAFDDLQKEIDQLRKRVDEKFPPTGVSITPLATGTESAAEQRQAKVRDLLKDGAPLFEDRKVTNDG